VSSLFVSELLKLRTIRATWGYALAAVGFSGLLAAGSIGSSGELDRLDPDFQFTLALDSAFPAIVLALLLGMLLVTNEFRHGTISRTLLVTPRRRLLVVLKLLTGAFAGVGLALLTFVTAAVVAVIWLGVLDVPLELGQAGSGLWRGLLAAGLVGVFGAAVGAVVHSQVGALVGTLVWIFVAEPIVWVLLGLVHWDGVSDYLPAATVLGIADTEGEGLSYATTTLNLCGWIVLAALLGTLRTERRDIT
jgi:ABC-type transport system involved in multi-copper enzyme maturation permease subunit